MSIFATFVVGLAVMPSAEPVFTDQQWNAAAVATTATGAAVSAPTASASIVSLLVSLVVVVALAIALGWLVKRLGVKQLVQGRGRHLEVVETVNLGLKRQAALLRVGGHFVLVGMAEQGLTALGQFQPGLIPEEQPPLAPPAPAPVPVDPAFAEMLKKAVRG